MDLAIDSYRYKNVKFLNLVNLSPSSQSLASRIGFTVTVSMCYRSEIILHCVPKKVTPKFKLNHYNYGISSVLYVCLLLFLSSIFKTAVAQKLWVGFR